MNVSDHIDRFKTPPFAHQLEDAQRLIDNPAFGLLNEMGTGKSKSVIDAACALHRDGEIDLVVVIAPASVRGVWLDPEFGEIKKHCWEPCIAYEFHSKGLRTIYEEPDNLERGKYLDWIVTNYEYIRGKRNRDRLASLIEAGRTMLVLDESSFVKSHTAVQTKACMELAPAAKRRVILNGTPITKNPLDMWPQLRFLSPKILPYANYYAFRATFAQIDTRFGFPRIVRWQNLDELQRLAAPYVIRREKKDCLDLPEKTYTTLEVRLDAETWKLYQKMKKEAVVWLEQNPSLAGQAGVKLIRLAQITSGFLGGFTDDEPIKKIGNEKASALEARVKEWLDERDDMKIIVWCRFRRDIEELAFKLETFVPAYKLYGAQKRADRERAIKTFSAGGETGHAVLLAQPQAGGYGLNLVGSSTAVYFSHDYNLAARLQSEDRVHRPGQTRNVLYTDMIATGPDGQRTIDHIVVAALRAKQELAAWTAGAWKRALLEE